MYSNITHVFKHNICNLLVYRTSLFSQITSVKRFPSITPVHNCFSLNEVIFFTRKIHPNKNNIPEFYLSTEAMLVNAKVFNSAINNTIKNYNNKNGIS